MALETLKLALKKFQANDRVNVDEINDNYDKIDKGVGTVANDIEKVSQTVNEISQTLGDVHTLTDTVTKKNYKMSIEDGLLTFTEL